jgi:hypothetical protein
VCIVGWWKCRLAPVDCLTAIIPSFAGKIVEAQALSGGPAGSLEFGEGADELVLDELVPLPELRRHKRSFMKLVTQNAFSNLKSSDAAVCMFVAYLRDHLEH